MKNSIMKSIVIYFIVSISQILYAQKNKFEVTIEFSPNYSGITDEVVNENLKLSYNALIRIAYNQKGAIKPTIGFGIFNAGTVINSEIGGQLGIESIKFINNSNYIYIPIGAKIDLPRIYFQPEVGVGINISNRTKQETTFSNGEVENETKDSQLNFGEFNSTIIPISLVIGTDFEIGNTSMSTGVKGYYSLNSVVKDVPRNNHYFGLGLILAINL